MKLKSLIFGLAGFVLAVTAQAQVKIGANPTTIGATSALEIEATGGQKVIVNKTDATVTLGNVPTGATTDQLLSIGSDGTVRKQAPADVALPAYVFDITGNTNISVAEGSNSDLTFPTNNFVTPATATADRISASTWVCPRTGVYRIESSATIEVNNNAANVSGQFSLILSVNNNDVTGSTSNAYTRGPGNNRGTGNAFVYEIRRLTAGDQVKARISTCLACGPNFYYVGGRRLTIQRLE